MAKTYYFVSTCVVIEREATSNSANPFINPKKHFEKARIPDLKNFKLLLTTCSSVRSSALRISNYPGVTPSIAIRLSLSLIITVTNPEYSSDFTFA